MRLMAIFTRPLTSVLVTMAVGWLLGRLLKRSRV